MGHERFSLGLNGATIAQANLESGLTVAKDAGFSYYEPRIPALIDCEEHGCRERALASLRDTDLSWLPLNALEGLFELTPDRLLARGEEVFSLAERFNVHQVIIVPGKGRPSFFAAQELLAKLRDLGDKHGVSLLYEFIGFAEHAFSTLREAHTVANAAGLPLVLDTFHLAVSKTDPERIVVLPAAAIGLVHLSDALTEGKTMAEITDSERVLPGEGGLPLADYVKAILNTGYAGPFSVEVFHPKYKLDDPAMVAKDAFRRASRLLATSP